MNLHQLINENNNNSIEIDEKFFIKNIDTGEIYHFQNDDSYQKIFEKINPNLTIKPSKISQNPEKIWQQYWKIIRKTREKLWDSCEIGDIPGLLSFLTTIKTSHTPIDINDRTLNRYTALHLACEHGHEKIVEILLKNRANIEALTSFGRTPLHLACNKGFFCIVKELIKAGACVDICDEEHNTPLHMASEKNYSEIIKELLKKKPKFDTRNYQGMTAYDVCLDVKSRRLFELGGINEELTESFYSRTDLGDTIFNNGRKDHVEKLLFLGQKNKILVSSEMIKNELNGNIGYNLELNVNEESKEENILGNELVGQKIFKEKKDDKNTNKYKKEDKNTKNTTNNNSNNSKSSKSPFRNFLNFNFFNSKDPEKPLSLPKLTLSDFKFFKLLGKGSFGEVYLVQEKNPSQIPAKSYAMKVLNKDKVFSQNLIKYVKSERTILSIMDHPFIVKLNYAFQTHNKLFLILDYCPGGDLGKLLSKKRRFPEEIARIYISEIILGIEALHSKNIIFRDLKPDNVVLDKEGHVLLTDFGLSRQGVDNNITKSFCGSVAYLAPEMLEKNGHNKTIDWYLVGVLFYELLVGIPPFFSKNREEMFNNIKSGPLLIPKNLSSEAKDLMKRLLCRNPKNRLGALFGAQEVKIHPFFKEIDWGKVMNRKLVPPEVEIKEIPENPDEELERANELKEKEKGKDMNYIDGWSFEDKMLMRF